MLANPTADPINDHTNPAWLFQVPSLLDMNPAKFKIYAKIVPLFWGFVHLSFPLHIILIKNLLIFIKKVVSYSLMTYLDKENSLSLGSSAISPQEKQAHKEAKKAEKTARVLKCKAAEAVSPATPTPTVSKLEGQTIVRVRFSQDSIDSLSSDGVDLFEVIRREGWKKGTSISVVRMPDSECTSLDNRRLHAAKRIVQEVSTTFGITAELREHSVTTGRIQQDAIRIAKKVLAKNSRHSVEQTELKLQEGTYGAMVYYRMRLGEGNFDSEPYGFTEMPIIRSIRVKDNDG